MKEIFRVKAEEKIVRTWMSGSGKVVVETDKAVYVEE